MENINKEKMIKYVKGNKVKVGLIGAGGLLVLVLVLNGLIAMFSGNDRIYNTQSGYDDEYMEQEMLGSDFAAPTTMMIKSSRGISADIMPITPQSEGAYDNADERKLVKNGNLSLVVKDIEIAQSTIKQITKNFKGFVQSSNFSENEQYGYYGNERRVSSISKRGYFEIKVPVASFENAFSEFKKSALKVNNESISGSDVTEQYADLESQIANKKSEVTQYREIMRKASKIEDVLKVTQYLNRAQSALDSLQGRMNRLSNQVELSTIRVDIISEKDVEAFGVTWAP